MNYCVVLVSVKDAEPRIVRCFATYNEAREYIEFMLSLLPIPTNAFILKYDSDCKAFFLTP